MAELNGKNKIGIFSVISIIIVVIGWLFVANTQTNSKVDRFQENTASIINGYDTKLEEYRNETSEMKGDIKEIKTDINWIKKALGGY